MTGLGKGLKTGGELFKRTEPLLTPQAKDTKPQMQYSAKPQEDKGAEVRKHIVLSADLSERLRRYCYEKRQKEAHVIRRALDEYLTTQDY